MPYKIRKDKARFCVYNSATNDKKGCSDTKEEAVAHMRALYANESKELGTDLTAKEIDLMTLEAVREFDQVSKDAEQEPEPVVEDNVVVQDGEDEAPDDSKEKDENATKEEKHMSYGYTPYHVTTYAELQDMRDAQIRVNEITDLVHTFPSLAMNVIESPDIEDKEAGIASLASELASLVKQRTKEQMVVEMEAKAAEGVVVEPSFVEKTVHVLKNLFGIEQGQHEENSQQALMIWKEGSRYQWLARYSNNRRDRDLPPEIISSKSHQTFVDKVEKGLAPYPELWLWHVKEWKIGQATWLAYDETGFAMAAGYFNKGCEPVAEWLSKQSDFLVSHGMPPYTIKRDPEDSSVIIEHETRELSPLPSNSAANELTGFFTISKEAEMAIPEGKRAELIENFGLSGDTLDELEKRNKAMAADADEQGVESKEVTEDALEAKEEVTTDKKVEEAKTEEVAETEAETTDEAKETDPSEEATPEAESPYPTRKEVADGVAEYFRPLFEEQAKRVGKVEEGMKQIAEAVLSLNESTEEKVIKAIQDTPMSSISALLSQNMERSVGNEKSKVDGRESLAKQKPKETPVPKRQLTPVPFLNDMLNKKEQEE